jgi:hypothetical protein
MVFNVIPGTFLEHSSQIVREKHPEREDSNPDPWPTVAIAIPLRHHVLRLLPNNPNNISLPTAAAAIAPVTNLLEATLASSTVFFFFFFFF